MMTKLTLVLITFYCSCCFSQDQKTDEIVVSNISMKTLYRGYPHTVKIGNNSGRTNYSISGKNISFERDSLNSNSFNVIPVGNQEAEVYFIDNEIKDTFSVEKLVVTSMPQTQIYWGTFTDGDQATSRDAKMLHAKYGPGIPLLKASFLVNKWIISIEGSGKTYSGTGNELTEEALKFIMTAEPGSVLNISCIYSGTGTGGRPASAVIKL